MDWDALGGWIGGIAGGVIGLGGGFIGTYFTVKNTKGPRERAFAVKRSILCWVLVALFVAGMWLIPLWYSFLLILPYVVVLVFAIRKFNATQLQNRKEELGSDAERADAADRKSFPRAR